jgi:N-methylhydantoinase A
MSLGDTGLSGLVCGIDIGGTFTDCVVAHGPRYVAAKADSTPDDLVRGVLTALTGIAGQLDLPLEGLLPELRELVLGSTVGTNAVIQGRGARTALLTTRGFEDTLVIMRGGLGRTAGRSRAELADARALRKPVALVPSELRIGVIERVAFDGRVIVPLDQKQAIAAADMAVSAGAEAMAICLLWSSVNPDHELAVRNIVASRHPDLFVTCSHQVSRRVGEYERSVATVLNAALGPLNARLTANLGRELRRRGFGGRLLFSNCSGGVLPEDTATSLPILLVGSGPAGGAAASAAFAAALADEDVLLCDMGGTTFDAGLLVGRSPLLAAEDVVSGYSFYQPRVDITSIGAGGGSIAWIDGHEVKPRLRVGPKSAGSDPGPACYQRGGKQPTVTDANLVLGYLSPDGYFGPDSPGLDTVAASEALATVGDVFGWDVIRTAAAIRRIVDSMSAELLRQLTVGRGVDPRGLTAYAYGGGGPLHAGAIFPILGIGQVRVPVHPVASSWSAVGAATSGISRVITEAVDLRSPWSGNELEAHLAGLAHRSMSVLRETAADGVEVMARVTAMIGYAGQAKLIELPLRDAGLAASSSFSVDPDALMEEFFQYHDTRYGEGFSYRDRPLQISEFRCVATVSRNHAWPDRPAVFQAGAEKSTRRAWWPELGEFADTPVYNALAILASGSSVAGPAIIEMQGSAVLVHPGQSADPVDRSSLALNLGITEPGL